jgi:hypothetical protein
MTAGGSITAGSVDAAGAITATATGGALGLGTVTGGGKVALSGASGVGATRITGADVEVRSAAGDIRIGAGNGAAATGEVVLAAADTGQAARDVPASGASGGGAAGPGSGAPPEARAAGADVRIGSASAGGAAGDVTSTAGAVVLVAAGAVDAGRVSAATSLEARSTGAAVRLGEATAGGALTLTSRGLLRAGAVTAGLDATLSSAAGDVDLRDVRAGGAMTIGAEGSISAGALSAARNIRVRSVRGDITLGDLVGGKVNLDAEGGDIVVTSVRGETLRASARAGAGGPGSVRIAGLVDLRTPAASAQTQSPASTPSGANEASLLVRSADSIALDGPVTTERDIILEAGGTVRIAGPLTIRDAYGDRLATAEFEGLGRIFGGLDIRAGDIDLLGDVSVAGGTGVHIASRGSTLRAGSDAGAGGLVLSTEEISRIRAPLLALRAGLAADASADLVLGSLALDRARINQLLLTAGSAGRVRVVGTLTGTGAPGVTIGETAQRPGRIEVTGALGTAAGRLGDLRLISAGDILIGSQAFVDFVNAASDRTTVDIRRLAPTFGGVTAGQLFLAAGATVFEAPGVILSQNTGGRLGGGLLFATGEAPAFGAATTPARIEVFGVATGPDGTEKRGRAAALLPGAFNPSITPSPSYRINGFVFGTGAGDGGGDLLATIAALALPPPAPPQALVGENPSGNSSKDPSEDEEERARRTAQSAGVAAEEFSDDARAGPIRIEPSARALLNPSEVRDARDPGIGAANEDLWPGAPQ